MSRRPVRSSRNVNQSYFESPVNSPSKGVADPEFEEEPVVKAKELRSTKRAATKRAATKRAATKPTATKRAATKPTATVDDEPNPIQHEDSDFEEEVVEMTYTEKRLQRAALRKASKKGPIPPELKDVDPALLLWIPPGKLAGHWRRNHNLFGRCPGDDPLPIRSNQRLSEQLQTRCFNALAELHNQGEYPSYVFEEDIQSILKMWVSGVNAAKSIKFEPEIQTTHHKKLNKEMMAAICVDGSMIKVTAKVEFSYLISKLSVGLKGKVSAWQIFRILKDPNAQALRVGLNRETLDKDAPHNVPFGKKPHGLSHKDIEEAIAFCNDFHVKCVQHGMRRSTLKERLKNPLGQTYLAKKKEEPLDESDAKMSPSQLEQYQKKHG